MKLEQSKQTGATEICCSNTTCLHSDTGYPWLQKKKEESVPAGKMSLKHKVYVHYRYMPKLIREQLTFTWDFTLTLLLANPFQCLRTS